MVQPSMRKLALLVLVLSACQAHRAPSPPAPPPLTGPIVRIAPRATPPRARPAGTSPTTSPLRDAAPAAATGSREAALDDVQVTGDDAKRAGLDPIGPAAGSELGVPRVGVRRRVQ